jgi:hypothetical protein
VSTDEKVRLLFCDKCKTVDELPAYDGPSDFDGLLQYRVSQHQFDSGLMHPLSLARVEKSVWQQSAMRNQIIQQFAMEQGYVAPGAGAGLGQTFYEVKANFQQDAMTCWKQHNRTTDCADYRTDAKFLLADTKEARRAEGLDTSLAARPKHWLCDYCPVHSIVMQKQNAAKGLYD